ncbi:AEC family transporter [Castellaniella sp.]|uniref:AEC family transporter n=1 Tax=Castellaniella sp. TaxID=1955812 RepID=UPI00355E56BA
MLLTLLNIVLPVFAVSALGFFLGRKPAHKPEMAFINYANVMVFCPAMVFSALLENPVDLARGWPLIVAGVLIILLPGLLLSFIRVRGISRSAFLVPGMFRNTGNIGIPLMMLAYGRSLLGDIIILFVLSNLVNFSIGLYLMSRGRSRWMWLRNPNIWAAVIGMAMAPWKDWIPAFFVTTVDLTGQIAIPLMLFGLGVRLAQDRIQHIGLALYVNGLYLVASLLSLPVILSLLPLTPEWTRLLVLSIMLPPAVLNYLLAEQYQADPGLVASVVLLGNVMSVVTIPVVVWVTLTWI